MKDHRPTVIATIGPDLGLTPEERRIRRDKAALHQEIRGTMGRVARIEAKLLLAIKAADEPRAALFRAKLKKAKRVMKEAELRLKELM